MPAAAAARHHQPLADASGNQRFVRLPVNLRVFPPQAIVITPVRGTFAAFQQAGTRQQQGSGAGRSQRRTGLVTLAHPLRFAVIAIIQRRPGADGQITDNHHIGRDHAVQTGVGVHEDIVVHTQRLPVAADDPRQQRRIDTGLIDQMLPVAAGTRQQIVETEQRRSRAIRCRQKSDSQGRQSFSMI